MHHNFSLSRVAPEPENAAGSPCVYPGWSVKRARYQALRCGRKNLGWQTLDVWSCASVIIVAGEWYGEMALKIQLDAC